MLVVAGCLVRTFLERQGRNNLLLDRSVGSIHIDIDL